IGALLEFYYDMFVTALQKCKWELQEEAYRYAAGLCASPEPDGGSSSTGPCAMPLIDGLLGIATAGLANRKRDRLILKGAIWFQVIYVKRAGLLNARGTNDFAFADRTERARPLYLRTSIRRSSQRYC